MQQYLFDETRDQHANVFCLFHAEIEAIEFG